MTSTPDKPGRCIDLRRATELSPDHDKHILVQSSLVNVTNQRRHGPVVLRKHEAEKLEVVTVRVPVI